MVRRGRALFLSCLLLAGQAVGLAHVALVTHITCPEHGDLVHPRTGADASRAAGSAWYAAGEALGSEHADHCAAAFHNGERLTVPPPVPAGATTALEPFTCAPVLADSARTVAIFRLAPKTSPPLAS